MVEEGWSARTRPGRRPRDVLAEVGARSKGCPSHWRRDGCSSEGGGGHLGRGMNSAGPAAPGPERQESRRRNAGGGFAVPVFCLPHLSGVPVCLCCLMCPPIAQCRLPVLLMQYLVLVFGGCRQFRRGSSGRTWDDVDSGVDVGVGVDVNERCRLVVWKYCTVLCCAVHNQHGQAVRACRGSAQDGGTSEQCARACVCATVRARC